MKRLWSAGPRRTRTSRLTRPVQSRPWPCHRKSNRKSIRLRSLICDPDSILLKSDRGNLLPFGGAHRDAVPRASPHALRAPLTNTPPAELGIDTLKPPYRERASWRGPCRPLQPRPGCARANAFSARVVKISTLRPPAPLQDRSRRASRLGVGQTHARESPGCASRPESSCAASPRGAKQVFPCRLKSMQGSRLDRKLDMHRRKLRIALALGHASCDKRCGRCDGRSMRQGRRRVKFSNLLITWPATESAWRALLIRRPR